MATRLQITDATLREGMQAPGVSFDIAQSVTIAKHLTALGVDLVECGHASVSAFECARIRAVGDALAGTPLLVHARANRADIAAADSVGADWVGIFLGVNDVTTRSRVRGRSFDDLVELIRDSIHYAKSLGLRVRYTVEDSSRTGDDALLAAYRVAVAAGADRLCFADTVGELEPTQVRRSVLMIKAAFPHVEVEVHLHDDRGLAIANGLAAIDAGADSISTSVNGLGERCGITDLATLLANLHHRSERTLGRPDVLQAVSAVVARYAALEPDAQRPVVGKHAFTHTAKLHVRAVRAYESAYSWIDPRWLGRAVTYVEPADPDEKPPGHAVTSSRSFEQSS